MRESTIFTLVGRKISKPDHRIGKRNSFSRSSGTLFGVSATPKSQRRDPNAKSGETTETSDKSNEKLNPTNSAKQSTDYKICQNKENFLKVSANEKLKSEQSVPQEVPTETTTATATEASKQFCQVMTEEKEVKPLENNSDKQVNKEVASDRGRTTEEETDLFEPTKCSTTLKSPSIVKEVMKSMAIVSRESSTVDYRLTKTKIVDSFGKTNGLSGGDTEAMLVIQELDRSIAEASPSTANSPLNRPRIHENLMSSGANGSLDHRLSPRVSDAKMSALSSAISETALGSKSFGIRPTKPPRLVSASIEAKHKTLIEVNETQTDNLIEELYVSDGNGHKLDFGIDSTDLSISNKVLNPLLSIKVNNSYADNSRNGIDMNISDNIKPMSGQVTNNLDGTITCKSSRSVLYFYLRSHCLRFHALNLLICCSYANQKPM